MLSFVIELIQNGIQPLLRLLYECLIGRRHGGLQRGFLAPVPFDQLLIPFLHLFLRSTFQIMRFPYIRSILRDAPSESSGKSKIFPLGVNCDKKERIHRVSSLWVQMTYLKYLTPLSKIGWYFSP